MNTTSFWWAAIAAVLCVFSVSGTPSLAQDEPVPPAVAPDAPATAPADRGDNGRPPELLSWMIRTSGIFGFLLMLVAFIMVANIMTIGLQLRRENFVPTSFVEQFEQRLLAKDFQGAFSVAKESDSLIGRILARGMSRIGSSVEEAEAGMQEVGEDETMAMEHKISYLALISSIAPMLGLLGTVTGMVYSFQAIASANTSPRPNELADGIATALFTTLEGLVVAIPAIVFYNLYRNRLSRFLMECGFVATSMLKRFPKAVS